MNASIANALRPVDALNVRVLVDNVTDSLSTVPQGVMHEWGYLKATGNLVLSGEALCCAAFGLSLVITARLGNAHHVLLFDAGPEAYAISRNGDRLKIDFANVGAIVLSHGHWDHAGGLGRSTRSLPRMAASQCPATSIRACFGAERSDSPTEATFRSSTFRASRHSVAPELPSSIRQSLVCCWRICFTSVERSRASHPTSADCSVTCSARETTALGNRILGLWMSATWLRTSRTRESSCLLHARMPASSTS